MCLMLAGLALSAASSVAGTVLSAGAANTQKWATAAADAQTKAQQETYRADLMEYNNTTYASNIEYREQVMDFQKSEWDRQVDFVTKQTGRAEENYFTKMGALLTQAFEQQIAETFQIQSTEAQGRSARGTLGVSTGERNIDGNTVRMLEGELFRQEGEALTTIDLNRQSRDRQVVLEQKQLSAEHYTRVSSLQLQADSPLAPIQTPSPVAQVAPIQTPQRSNNGLLIAASIGSAVGSFVTGASKAGLLKF